MAQKLRVSNPRALAKYEEESPHVPGTPLHCVGRWQDEVRAWAGWRRERRRPRSGSAGRERKAARGVRRRLILMRHGDVSYVDEEAPAAGGRR